MTRTETLTASTCSLTGEPWALYRTQQDGSMRAAPMDAPYGSRQVYLGSDGGVRTGPNCPPDIVQWYLEALKDY